MEVLKKLNIEVPSNPAIPYPGHRSRKKQNLKRHLYPTIMAVLGTITKTWKQLRYARAGE